MITIYGLFIDGRCVYVGRTKSLPVRTPSNNRRCLRLFGKTPEVRALRRVHPDLASKIEWETIRDFKTLGQADLNRICGQRKNGAKPSDSSRQLAVYKDDYDFFSELADQNDRSRARMFRYAMAQIREGKPVPYVGGENGEGK